MMHIPKPSTKRYVSLVDSSAEDSAPWFFVEIGCLFDAAKYLRAGDDYSLLQPIAGRALLPRQSGWTRVYGGGALKVCCILSENCTVYSVCIVCLI